MTNIIESSEAPGDLLATGWAAPLVHPTTAEYALGEHACHLAAQRDRAESLGVVQRNEILRQCAVTAELRHRLALAEKARDEALGSGFRERAARIRAEADNRALRERLDALTRANHGLGRRSLADRFGSWAR